MDALQTSELQDRVAQAAGNQASVPGTVNVDRGALKKAAELLAQGKPAEQVQMAIDLLYGEGAFAKVVAFRQQQELDEKEEATKEARIAFQERLKNASLITMPPEEMRGYRITVEYGIEGQLDKPSVSITRIRTSSGTASSGTTPGVRNGSGGSIVKIEHPLLPEPQDFPTAISYRQINPFIEKLAAQYGIPIGEQKDCEYAPHFKNKFGKFGWIATLTDGTRVGA